MRKGRGLARDRKGSLHFSLSFFFVSKLRLTLMRSDIIFFFLKIEAKLGDVAISFYFITIIIIYFEQCGM